jgi:hypothetical protein
MLQKRSSPLEEYSLSLSPLPATLLDNSLLLHLFSIIIIINNNYNSSNTADVPVELLKFLFHAQNVLGFIPSPQSIYID